nr:NAC domain-containing protein 72-like [Tanacetum cinerariifolium]
MLDDWVLCRIYKKNSSAEKTFPEQAKTEPSHISSSSSSSQFDDVLDSFPNTIPAMDNKYLSFQNNKTTLAEDEDQKVDMTANYGWARIAAYGLQDPTSNNANPSNGSSMDTTFDMQMKYGKSPNDEVENGIRSQRMENSGYLFSQSFVNSNDPFAIRYPTQSSGSGYREGKEGWNGIS